MYYTREEVIAFLESKDYEKFDFYEDERFGTATIDTKDGYEICIETVGGEITEENRLLALKVLKELDEAVNRARPWLGHFNLKHDRWHPDALDAGYVISFIYIGRYETGGMRRPQYHGFAITFDTVNPYPDEFTVKYLDNFNPFSVEETVS